MHRDEVGEGPLWIFKATGRAARVVQIRSYREHDVVIFRFCGLPNSRHCSPKQFLRDFVRLS